MTATIDALNGHASGSTPARPDRVQAAAAHARAEYDALADTASGYPANHFAFQQMLNVLLEEGAHRVLEVGIGHGNAIPLLAGAGLEVTGLEIDDALVEKSRGRIVEAGRATTDVHWGDIEDAASFTPLRAKAGFDALIAMGVLPHVRHERTALENMRSLVRPGGLIFVECRNQLFSLVTFNRYTHEFILDELLHDAPAAMREAVDEFLRPRLLMDRPPMPAPGAHAPLFHNPLTVPALFAEAGFEDIRIRPFHYHAGMPALEAELPREFRDGSIAMENEPSGWRGLFLCSAYVVQARRPGGDH